MEPYIKALILTPEEYVGPVMELCREHRSESQKMNYLSAGRIEVTSEMPLGEVLFDFYGKLKMITRGYGSFDYDLLDYREYEGGFLRSHRLTMVNHQTGKSTDLVYSEYEFGVELEDNDFVKDVLHRVR